MKKLILTIILSFIVGCGSINTTSQDTLTAAKLINGTWDLSYNIEGVLSHKVFGLFPINTFPTIPDTGDIDFDASTMDMYGFGTLWTVKYTSANHTWTIQNSKAEFVFQADGTKLLPGACFYETKTDGTKSPCVPLAGVKTGDTPPPF